MEFNPTFATTESRTFSVPFVGMPTVRTLLRGVSGIHQEHMLSKSLCLVHNKLFKLVERPAIQLPIELFTSALLNPDLAQIFKSKYGVLRVHYLLRYAVVGISRKPSFLTGHSLELAFGRFGAFGLQLLTKIGILSTPTLNLLRVEKCIIRADYKIHYPAIYSKDFKVFDLLRIVVLQRYMQIEYLVSAIIRDCRGLDSPAKVISVMRWHEERCLNPSFSASNCGQSMHEVHGDNSLIISHCREWLSFWKRFTFDRFQSFTSTVPSSLNQGGRKIGDALTGEFVSRFVVVNLVPGLVLISPFCRDRERFGVSPHRIEEGFTILVRQPKLECHRPKHVIYEDG